MQLAGNLEMSILIGAALAGSFNGTFNNAGSAVSDLQKRLDDLSKISGKIDNYQKLTDRINTNQAAFVAMRKEARELKEGLEKVPPEGSRESFEKLSKQADKLQQRLDKDRSALVDLRPQLTGAGVDLRDMAAAQKNVVEESERLIKTQRDLAEVQGKIDSAREKLAGAKGKIIASAGPLLAMGKMAKTAMNVESAMANIRKVVEFDEGKEAEQLEAMKQGFMDLSKRIPMAAIELMQIGESAGQLGIAKEEILQFTEDAAKMGVAFDISAERAGETMASWRTALKLNEEGVVALADKVNLLGNTTAASSPDISEVITRIGALSGVAGVADGSLAALAASLVAAGTAPEVSATGLKNLLLALNAGNSATKMQYAAMVKLGYDPENGPAEIAKRMQEDSSAVILEVFEKIGQQAEHEQAAIIRQFFGKESVAAIAPLLTNLEFLKENLEKVNDPSLYGGSMEKEFQARADTTENSVQLLKNSLTAFSETIGQHLLPVIDKAAGFLSTVLNAVTSLAQEFPGLTQAVALAGAAWGTWKVFDTTVSLGRTAVDLFVNLKRKTKLLQTATDAQAKSQGALNLVMNANPVFLLITGIALLGAAFYYAYNHCEWFREEVDTAWETMKTGAQVWADKLGEFAGNVGTGYENLQATVGRCTDAIKAKGDEWGEKLDNVADRAGEIWGNMQTAVEDWKYKHADAIDYVANKLAPFIELIDKVCQGWSNFKTIVGMDETAPKYNGVTPQIVENLQALERAGRLSSENTEQLRKYEKALRDQDAEREIRGFASGGIFTKPQFGLFAEDGTESIIPHNPGGEDIWRATGEMAGFSTGMSEEISFSPSFNLTVNAGSGADGNAIGRQIIREIEAELPRMLKRFKEQQARVAYS
jgi:TP901 family phage tail tape measure protein